MYHIYNTEFNVIIKIALLPDKGILRKEIV